MNSDIFPYPFKELPPTDDPREQYLTELACSPRFVMQVQTAVEAPGGKGGRLRLPDGVPLDDGECVVFWSIVSKLLPPDWHLAAEDDGCWLSYRPPERTISPELLKAYFTYHAPTDETRPKYRAIEAARRRFYDRVMKDLLFADDLLAQTKAACIREEALLFAEAINEQCPVCSDTALAIHHLRMAVAGINQIIFQAQSAPVLWEVELSRCLVIANRAIALGGR